MADVEAGNGTANGQVRDLSLAKLHIKIIARDHSRYWDGAIHTLPITEDADGNMRYNGHFAVLSHEVAPSLFVLLQPMWGL
jgi:hypothetical protein